MRSGAPLRRTEKISSGPSNARARTAAGHFLKALLGCKGRQLELLRPTGSVLSVEVVERLRDLYWINQDVRLLLCVRQSTGAWRVNKTVDYDFGDVHAILRIF